MFKLDQSDTFTWPVEVYLPQDGGKQPKETFDVQFKRVSQSRLNEIAVDVSTDKMNDKDVCREVVIGWGGITENGDAVPFSPGNLDRVLDIPGVARAICTSFVAAHKGSAAKN